MSVPGRKRKLTDEQVRQIRDWKSLADLARQWGVTRSAVKHARTGQPYKQPSP
jgi:hypothetical protein